MKYQFTETNHYRTIQTFFDARKDFIVLGLCGKTGSGSTTASEILQTPFEQMNLPIPGDTLGSDLESYEYRILYNYAKTHWRPFYRIKSSALITAHILDGDSSEFVKFLQSLFSKQLHEEDLKLEEVAQYFFEGYMQFSLEDEFDLAASDKANADEWFAEDALPRDANDNIIQFTPRIQRHTDTPAQPGGKLPEMEMRIGDNPVKYQYDKASVSVFFTTKDLYRIFKEYKERRKKKTGFANPLWIFLLQKFIYEYLPQRASQLWKKLSKIEHGLEIIAQQQLGNNLRISGTPYDTDFSSEAYSTIVEDINHSIKLLSAYLAWRKKWAAEIPDKENYIAARRSVVVIDSIKNPFESAYLKSRYTNYYLFGIYTEDNIRYQRLLENQRFPKTHIEAIDIIEQLSAFKDAWKTVGNLCARLDELRIEDLAGKAAPAHSAEESGPPSPQRNRVPPSPQRKPSRSVWRTTTISKRKCRGTMSSF